MTWKVVTGISIGICALGCFPEKDLQVKLTTVKLMHIDTVTRGESVQKVLTWKTAQNIKYLSYGDLDVAIPVGSTMMVFIER